MQAREILAELNPRQAEAVSFGKGPLLIIAGAGTGKTKVITHRIAYLIASKLARPEEILGLTFTDKAANEMEERVDVLVPYGWIPVQISTFHSFGQRILREYAFEIGIDPDFKVLSTPELLVFLKEQLFELHLNYFRPLSYPTKYLHALLSLISRVKDEDVTSKEYVAHTNSMLNQANSDQEREEAMKHIEIAKCYQKYDELLAKSGYLDMPNLITLPLKLLRTKKSVLNKLQQQFKYILIDEFQDTNYAQFQLIKLLAEPHHNITVVGDDDQSIYKFRGACLANILSFKESYPDTHTVVLNQNYRSTQAILDRAYHLITFNNPNRLEVKTGVDKSIVGIKTGGAPVQYNQYDTVSSEADGVADIIENKVKLGARYSDFAILVRTNQSADPFIRALNMSGIPWTFSGNQGLYDREEIKILIALLRVLRDIDDTQSLYYLINSPVYRLDSLDLSRCLGLANKSNQSLYRVLETKDIEISPHARIKIDQFLKDIRYFSSLSQTYSTGKVLYEFITRTGWLKTLTTHPSIRSELAIKNIAEFMKIVENIGNIITTDRVPFVIDYIESLYELGDNPPVAQADFDIDAVHILTVHKAKGLEFKNVLLVSLVSDIFPHRKMPSLIELPIDLVKEPIPDLPSVELHIQEERRLFYVGMTRAKDELILTSAVDYGGKRKKRPSQFVIEALDILKTDIVTRKIRALDKIRRVPKTKEPPIELLKPTGILELSSTGIDDWLTCPRKYWYIHRLRVPTPKHHTIVYGSAIHNGIGAYLSEKKDKRPITLEQILSVFEKSWVSEGFISRQHEEERFEKGKVVLCHFFEQEERSELIPTLVEERFSFLLGGVRIRGRWDRIDESVIIDYKTGDIDTQVKAERRVKGSVQLPIYALAYKERFGKLPTRVEFHFVDTGIIGQLKGIEKSITRMKSIINEVARAIWSGDFQPNPKYNACEFCTCRALCTYSSDKGK